MGHSVYFVYMPTSSSRGGHGKIGPTDLLPTGYEDVVMLLDAASDSDGHAAIPGVGEKIWRTPRREDGFYYRMVVKTNLTSEVCDA